MSTHDPEFWYGGLREGDDEQHEEHQHDPGTSRFWGEVRREMSAEWSAVWKERRRVNTVRKQQLIAEELKRKPTLPDWFVRMPPSELSDKQREALVLTIGHGLTIREAARHIGVYPNAILKRIEAARVRVESYWGTWNPAEFGFVAERDTPLEDRSAELALADANHYADYLVPLVRRQHGVQLAAERLGSGGLPTPQGDPWWLPVDTV